MKLSESQAKVIRLLQEGWELGVDTSAWRGTLGERTVRLQKYGLGRGDPVEHAKILTIESLERKGLIEALPNPYVCVQPTVYKLTQKGKELK
jgi:hypothetical protein